MCAYIKCIILYQISNCFELIFIYIFGLINNEIIPSLLRLRARNSVAVPHNTELITAGEITTYKTYTFDKPFYSTYSETCVFLITAN